MRHKSNRHQKGFTLVELLITMVISVIAMFALAVPFVAERNFWNVGKRQAGAQRDAQMAMHAIARNAREGSASALGGSNGDAVLTITVPCPGGTTAERIIEGGPAFGSAPYKGQLEMRGGCAAAGATTLIDGVRSKVTNMQVTEVVPDKLVRIRLEVTHQGQQNELLETELFLRNWNPPA